MEIWSTPVLGPYWRCWPRQASPPTSWPPSASPTSVRPPLSGTKSPGVPSTMPSCGSAAAPRRCASSSRRTRLYRLRPGAHRPAHRRLLLRHQAQLDPGPCGGARARAEAGDLLFGTVDSWLVWKLTGGKAHITDYTNASRTMLLTSRRCAGTPYLRPSGHPHVHAAPGAGLQRDLRLRGAPGGPGPHRRRSPATSRQPCSARPASPRRGQNTYGTGCFLLMNTGERLYRSKNGLLSTIAIGPGRKVQYALEGLRLRGRRGDPVDPGRAALHWRGPGRGVLRLQGAGHRRRLSGPRLHRPGGPYWDMYARGAGRTDPWHQPGPHHPGRPGVHRLSELGSGPCHGEGHRDPAHPAEGGRRGQPGPLS